MAQNRRFRITHLKTRLTFGAAALMLLASVLWLGGVFGPPTAEASSTSTPTVTAGTPRISSIEYKDGGYLFKGVAFGDPKRSAGQWLWVYAYNNATQKNTWVSAYNSGVRWNDVEIYIPASQIPFSGATVSVITSYYVQSSSYLLPGTSASTPTTVPTATATRVPPTATIRPTATAKPQPARITSVSRRPSDGAIVITGERLFTGAQTEAQFLNPNGSYAYGASNFTPNTTWSATSVVIPVAPTTHIAKTFTGSVRLLRDGYLSNTYAVPAYAAPSATPTTTQAPYLSQARYAYGRIYLDGSNLNQPADRAYIRYSDVTNTYLFGTVVVRGQSGVVWENGIIYFPAPSWLTAYNRTIDLTVYYDRGGRLSSTRPVRLTIR